MARLKGQGSAGGWGGEKWDGAQERKQGNDERYIIRTENTVRRPRKDGGQVQ